MPAGQTRAQFQRAMFPGLRAIIGLDYNKPGLIYSQIFNVHTSTSAFEEDYHIAGVGLPQLTDEDVEVPRDRMYRGLSVRYNNADYTLAVGFSHQTVRDAKIKLMQGRSRALAESFRQLPEVLLADTFNNGFITGAGIYGATFNYDNVALFANNHPLTRGGGSTGQVQSNILATPSTLSVSSYRDMLTLQRLLFDETGVLRITIPLRHLVVPPQLEFVAEEIVNSTGRPDTANRADNVTKGRTDIIVWNFLLNPKYWFMGADKAQHQLNCFWREKFRTRTWEDEETETQWLGGRCSLSYGYSDYIGWFGTNPT